MKCVNNLFANGALPILYEVMLCCVVLCCVVLCCVVLCCIVLYCSVLCCVVVCCVVNWFKIFKLLWKGSML